MSQQQLIGGSGASSSGNAPTSVAVNVKGIPVLFPKEPYPCQVEYMDKVITAIRQRTNALLESPTGTGKTLCLLCSSLAWQVFDARVNPHRPIPNAPPGDPLASMGKTVIIYATRTHSQLQQVVNELRSTAYRPKMSILGSRDQLCVHERISKLKGAALNHACSSIVGKHGCTYRNNLDGFSDGMAENEVLDIEDLTIVGKKKKICPYYYSRDTSAAADIVFMPYNYLLDSAIRRTMKINFENSVVIFDEAHNLEKVAADSASFTITSTDVAACIKELQKVLQKLREDEISSRTEDDTSKTSKGTFDFESTVEKPTLQGVTQILRSLFTLEAEFDNVDLRPNVVNETPAAKFPGRWLVDVFFRAGFINPEITDEVNRCVKYLMDMDSDEMKRVGGDAAVSQSIPKLEILGRGLERIFRSASSSAEEYKVYIFEKPLKPGGGNNRYQNDTVYGASSKKKRVINFWCFSTGVALRELTALGVRSVIVTSGTLSPIDALKEDFKIPFPIQLQNPHIISNHQILVSALSQGVGGVALNSSFGKRDATNYIDDLGNTIVTICDTLVFKDRDPLTSLSEGGVLIFFPSYRIMETNIERWKFTGIYDRMQSIMRHIIVEPRANSNNNNSESKAKENQSGATAVKKIGGFMLDSHSSSNSTSKGKSLTTDENNDDDEISEETFQGIVEEFDRSIDRYGRCLMVGVCRGKVSEGIDFSNNKGRAVILTGIPFAPHMDPWVALKREYLDEKAARKPIDIATTTTTTAAAAAPVAMAPDATAMTMAMASRMPGVAPSNPWLEARGAAHPDIKIYPLGSNPAGAPTPLANSTPATTAMATPSLPASVTPAMPMPVTGPTVKLTGQMWYQQSASRAVNQALGRVIRHKFDWGAIFLLDERFQYESNMSQLSAWMRPCVRKSNNAVHTMTSFTDFLRRVNQDPKLKYDRVLQAKAAQAAEEANRPRPFPARTRLAYEPAEADPFQKFIEVSGTQLANCAEDQFFISKDMIVRSGTQSTAGGGGAGGGGGGAMTEEELRVWEKLQETSTVLAPNPANKTAIASKDLKAILSLQSGGGGGGGSGGGADASTAATSMLPPPPPKRFAVSSGGFGGGSSSGGQAMAAGIPAAAGFLRSQRTNDEVIDLVEGSPVTLSSSQQQLPETQPLLWAGDEDDPYVDSSSAPAPLFLSQASQPEPLLSQPSQSQFTQSTTMKMVGSFSSSSSSSSLASATAAAAASSRFGLGLSGNRASLGSFSEVSKLPTSSSQVAASQSSRTLTMPNRVAAVASSSVPFSQATEAASQSTTTTTGSGVFSMTQRLQALSKGVATQHAKDERQKRVALEIKAFLDEAQQYVSERVFAEVKRFIDSWRQRGGLRGVGQMHPFQSELLALIDGHLQGDIPLSLKKTALQSMSCLVSDASLMNAYETEARQQMTLLLKRARDALEGKAPTTTASSSSSSSSFGGGGLSATQQPPSILAQAAARKVQAANAAARAQTFGVMGSENIDDAAGSKRAKLILQMSKATSAKPPSSQPTAAAAAAAAAALPSGTEGDKKKGSSLLEKLKEIDRPIGGPALIGGGKKFGTKPQQPVRVANVKCSVCMEEEEPLRAQCGHVCCKACWMKQLKIRAMCPICRTATDQSQLARIRVVSSSSSSSSSSGALR